MSGDKNKPVRHLEEQQDAAAQNGALDAFMTMSRIAPLGPARGIHFGATSFENYGLNQIIDIVESANPELLESAGTALVDARDSIKEAAEELKGNLGRIDWKGEAHKAFSDWADSLISSAQGIAVYADVIGTQVMAAGSGLASVRKSLPRRDTRTDPRPPKDFDEADKVETNDEYAAALEAEKNRQEAINQMYRLASFYTVSAGMMGKAEEPVLPTMPNVGVPEPTPSYGDPFKPGEAPPRPASVPGASTSAGGSAPLPGEAGSVPDSRLAAQPTAVDGILPRSVGTEIDSVGTLPPQEVAKPVNTAAPPTNGPIIQTGPMPPAAPNAIPRTVRGPVPRTTGPTGAPVVKAPPPARGGSKSVTGPGPAPRTGTGPLSQGPRATSPGPVGSRGPGPLGQGARPAMPGQTGGRGTGPAARGVVGGMPKTGGPAAGQVGGAPHGPAGGTRATPAGRSSTGTGRTPGGGVVGGRPVTGSVPGNNSSRLPRGTVIGGEGAPSPRTPGQTPGQRGVVGAPPAPSGTGQGARRPTTNPDGAVGAANGRTTPGTGSGGQVPARPVVPRGGAGKQRPDKRRPRRDEQRGDQATTD